MAERRHSAHAIDDQNNGGTLSAKKPRDPLSSYLYRSVILTVSFHIGAFCFVARQFGAFHFGDFHFDAVPVRRVSLWRASTSARFSLARIHFGAFLFGAFPSFVRTYDDPVSANASFARTICVHVSFPRRRVVYLFLRACFLSQ